MKVCIATSTRADWGLLSPLAKVLKQEPGIELQILATNMHLLPRYGMTVNEIIADGYDVTARIPMDCDAPSPAARVHAMAQCMDGCARIFPQLRPDWLVVLGDRFEMLAIASAATVLGIPIAHIAGGETSEGAIDDKMRHAITQLSSLHFTAAEPYRERVVQMTGTPSKVFNAGALGVYNITHQHLITHEQLQEGLGFKFTPGRLFVVTFHPATLDFSSPPGQQVRELLAALEQWTDYDVIITYPNNDTGSEQIITEIEKWTKNRPRTLLIKSLGMLRYLSAVSMAAAVIGNSSSGIVEVPSLGVPTVDIGIRQRGRLCGPSVLHCHCDTAAISSTIAQALAPDHLALSRKRINPYYHPDTPNIIASEITKTLSTSPSP